MSIHDDLALIEQAVARIRAAQPSDVQVVRAGGNLQAALDKGGAIELEPGATFEAARFTLRASKTVLRALGATIKGTSGPALHVPPGTSHIAVLGGEYASGYQSVIQLGDNSAETQGSEVDVPKAITLTDISIPTHRGKRGIEVNSAETVLTDCEIADVFDPGGADSQAVVVLNTTGQIRILGGRFSAGSEVIMVGGDAIKLPGVIPSDITITGAQLVRPLSWMSDGVRRVVKTSLEFKTGQRCAVSDCLIDGCWTDGQSGYGVTVTPRVGGSTTELTFSNVTLRNVESGYNVSGQNDATKPQAEFITSGIRIVGGSVVTNKGLTGRGRGTFLAMSLGPYGSVDVEGTVIVPEHSVVYHSDSNAARPIASFSLTNARAFCGTYGFTFGNVPHAGNLVPLGHVDISKNVLAGAGAGVKRAFPANTYETKEQFLGRPEVQAVLG